MLCSTKSLKSNQYFAFELPGLMGSPFFLKLLLKFWQFTYVDNPSWMVVELNSSTILYVEFDFLELIFCIHIKKMIQKLQNKESSRQSVWKKIIITTKPHQINAPRADQWQGIIPKFFRILYSMCKLHNSFNYFYLHT